jgi:hypothetical protein
MHANTSGGVRSSPAGDDGSCCRSRAGSQSGRSSRRPIAASLPSNCSIPFDIASARSPARGSMPGCSIRRRTVDQKAASADPVRGLTGICRANGRLNLRRAIWGPFTIVPAQRRSAPATQLALRCRVAPEVHLARRRHGRDHDQGKRSGDAVDAAGRRPEQRALSRAVAQSGDDRCGCAACRRISTPDPHRSTSFRSLRVASDRPGTGRRSVSDPRNRAGGR